MYVFKAEASRHIFFSDFAGERAPFGHTCDPNRDDWE